MSRIISVIFMLITIQVSSQSLMMTRTGQISFFSSTPLEDIKAVNNEVTSMLNTESGEIVYAVLIKSFHFEKALMEEHFNENYLESTRFPKATFSGKVIEEINFKKDGQYRAHVEGQLTIHGVTRPLKAAGTIEVRGDNVFIASQFKIEVADFDIKIPGLVKDNIAKSIEVTVNCQYNPKS